MGKRGFNCKPIQTIKLATHLLHKGNNNKICRRQFLLTSYLNILSSTLEM